MFYQLWGLSNVCTFFVMYYASYEKNREACMVAHTELPSADRDALLYQNEGLALDCDEVMLNRRDRSQRRDHGQKSWGRHRPSFHEGAVDRPPARR